MLNTYICEDNPNHLDYLKKSVKSAIAEKDLKIRIALATNNPYDVLNALEGNQFINIYLLDIELKSDINGLKLATKIRKLDPRGYIVFVTIHSEMSYLTFQYKIEAFDFIIKDEGNYGEQIKCVLCTIQERHDSSHLRKNKITFKKKGTHIIEDYSQIYAFETTDTPNRIYMIAKERQLTFTATLKNLEKKLDGRFFRCNVSCIINIDKIEKFDQDLRIVVLVNGKEFNVPIKKVNDLLKRL